MYNNYSSTVIDTCNIVMMQSICVRLTLQWDNTLWPGGCQWHSDLLKYHQFLGKELAPMCWVRSINIGCYSSKGKFQ